MCYGRTGGSYQHYGWDPEPKNELSVLILSDEKMNYQDAMVKCSQCNQDVLMSRTKMVGNRRDHFCALWCHACYVKEDKKNPGSLIVVGGIEITRM